MKLGVVNKSTAVNRFRNLTHLAVITQKKSKLEILKGGGKVVKSPFLFYETKIQLKYGQWVCLWDEFFVKVTLTFSSMASLLMNP